MTVSERDQFLQVFHNVLTPFLLSELETFSLPDNGKEWIAGMIQYTVPHGKMNRGLTVLDSYRSLNGEDLTEAQILDANILGWCLQAVFLVSDDIMDASITRRGAPCWYKQKQVGLIAINDSFILKSMIYRALKHFFKDRAYYVDLLDLFHEATYQTVSMDFNNQELGQLMDLITAPQDQVDLTKFSIEKHAYIVEYKTAYYSFYLPIALAMHLTGIKQSEAFAQAKAVLLPLGEYFQVQDDYLDCYGDPKVIGKIGTDILDNKCSWLINQALARASPDQRLVLDENYGKKDGETKVKQVFQELKIKELYEQYEEESYVRIKQLIDRVDLLPQEMFIKFMERIYKRQK